MAIYNKQTQRRIMRTSTFDEVSGFATRKMVRNEESVATPHAHAIAYVAMTRARRPASGGSTFLTNTVMSHASNSMSSHAIRLNAGTAVDAASKEAKYSNDSEAMEAIFDERFRIIDMVGCPVSGYPYYLESDGMRVDAGRTDADGFIPRTPPSKASSQLLLFLGDEALAKEEA